MIAKKFKGLALDPLPVFIVAMTTIFVLLLIPRSFIQQEFRIIPNIAELTTFLSSRHQGSILMLVCYLLIVSITVYSYTIKREWLIKKVFSVDKGVLYFSVLGVLILFTWVVFFELLPFKFYYNSDREYWSLEYFNGMKKLRETDFTLWLVGITSLSYWFIWLVLAFFNKLLKE